MKTVFLLLLVSAMTVAQPDKQIAKTLDDWHLAATEARFDDYFGMMADDAIFVGTDATEHWDVPTFKAFAKPFFDKGKAWHFTSVQRHIYLSKDGKTAWFDELLDTWMKICRGSGVMRKEKDGWKIVHYVLSMTIPNENTDDVIRIKKEAEERELAKLRKP